MNFQELVDLVRDVIGFPAPATGGTDRLSDTNIIRWLNDGFEKMTDEVLGLEKYTEFTITAGGVITVTEPAAGEDPPTIDLNNPPLLSYPSYTISDVRSYTSFENKTAAILDDGRRIMYRRGISDPRYQAYFNTTASFYRYYDLWGARGFTLLPLTIDQTNTIGITYKKNFTRYVLGTPVITGNGLDDITVGGIFTGTSNVDFRAEVTNTAADPNVFRWSNNGGSTWQPSQDMSTSAITLQDGVTVLWADTDNHTVTDYWDWTSIAPSLTDFKEDEQSGFPINHACYWVAKQIDDMRKPDFKKDAIKDLDDWVERRATVDDTMDFSLDNPSRIRSRDLIL